MEIPETKDLLIAALKANVADKEAIMAEMQKDNCALRALNRTLIGQQHKIHEAYGKPNLN